jgi:chromosome segregation ATPase
MKEDKTKDLDGKKSFEERVFARFDAMDARFDSIETRLEKLESRSYDTKPIWERALAAIMELGFEVAAIKKTLAQINNRVAVIETAIAGLTADVAILKTDVANLKTDVAVLKTDVADLKTNYSGLRNEFVEVRHELKHDVQPQFEMILKYVLEDRQDIRDAESRIRNLETKLA